MTKLEAEVDDDDAMIGAVKQIGKGLALSLQATAATLRSQQATDQRLKRYPRS